MSSWNFPFGINNGEDIDFSSIEKDFRRDCPSEAFYDHSEKDLEQNRVVHTNYVSDSSLSSTVEHDRAGQISPPRPQNVSYRAPAQVFEPIPFIVPNHTNLDQQNISDDEGDEPVEAFPDEGLYVCDHQEPQHYQSQETVMALGTAPHLCSDVTTVSNSSGSDISPTFQETVLHHQKDVSEKEIEFVLSDQPFSMNFDLERPKRFRDYQTNQWETRYKELKQVFLETGRSSVHHADVSKKGLARWIKRQRAQYKLRKENKPSSMTDERVQALNLINFVWDSHSTVWEDRLIELEAFRAKHNHCNVTSSNYPSGGTLVSWVKSQRRQFRLRKDGRKSNLTPKRIQQLESLGFQF